MTIHAVKNPARSPLLDSKRRIALMQAEISRLNKLVYKLKRENARLPNKDIV